MAIASFFVLVLITTAFIPQYVVIFLVLNLVIGLFLSIFQMVVALLPHPLPKRCKITSRPFVSIFVPAYDEPPAILMQTLDALSHLNYEHMEILVIDNNTQDPHVWKPVKAFVKTLGDHIRFFHVGHLSGFKAGAINYLLKRVDARSEYVAIIDADYLLEPHFLEMALSYFSDEKIALVQFPQKYRNCMKKNQPIADEYGHFFEIYMNMANTLDCVPSTGTVSVYKLKALQKIGGFRGETITEDADVGLRIYGAGYRGVYVDQPIGCGLMPYDLEAYRKQKWRWAFGNAQSLKTLFLLFGKISFKSWFGFLAHLTAWHHFHFLPFATLAAFPIIMYADISMGHFYKQVFVLAAVSIFVTLASKMLLFLITLRKQKKFFTRALKAFLIHMGMTLTYSEALIAFALQRKFGFERTNKFILQQMPSLLKNSYREIILGSWYVIGAIVSLRWGNMVVTIAFLVAALVLFSIFFVHFRIKPTKKYSEKIIAISENKYRSFILHENPL